MIPDPTVFIVDDDRYWLVLVGKLLRSAGFQVQTYCSAEAFLADTGVRKAEREYTVEGAIVRDEGRKNGLQPFPRRGCIVLDLQMDGMSGLDLQSHLASRGLFIPIVFVTAYASVQSAVAAMKAGAVDFLEKPVQPGTLSEAVANALAQDAEFRKVHEQTQRQTARRAEIQRRYKTLTRREQEILHLLLKQKSIKQIAHALGTSPHTVRNQHAAICEKMQAQSDMELLAMMHLVERVASDLAAVPAPELHLPWWPSKSPRP